jgi:peptide/nickel transport system ATP-binding protein
VLDVDRLHLTFAGRDGERPVLNGVSLSVSPGEIVAIVGESGSGKTLLARSILRLWPPGARCTGGTIRLRDTNLLTLSDTQLRRVRGAQIGMVFQEPMMSLNPALKVGFQLAEGLRLHTLLSHEAIRARLLDTLASIGFADPAGCFDRYPHEFSGGMRQRLIIASVLSLRPQLLIADEPTTALDAVIARQVLDTMVSASRELGTAVLLVSHDLSAVCRYANRVVVMRAGRVVESGRTADVLLAPREPYTRALLEALPTRRVPAAPPESETVAELRAVRVGYRRRARMGWRAQDTEVLRGINLIIRKGETLAVVGESGSGKTTLGRALLGLTPLRSGSVRLLGAEISPTSRDLPLDVRRRAQLVFQDPFASLDPRMRVANLIGEGLRAERLPSAERDARVSALLEEVGLSTEHARRFPHELSGGQRQRVGIARALVSQPALIVADEPVSALDVTVQAQVLALLERLQARFGFALLFVSHDLGVVSRVADTIAVLRHGRMVEWGPAERILDSPRHPYTRTLWSAAPRLRQAATGYELASDSTPEVPAPNGWSYAHRPELADRAEPLEVAPGHFALCERSSA